MEKSKIRPFMPGDLWWLESLARKWGEWETVKEILTDKRKYPRVGIWVIESKAALGIYECEGRNVAAGLCDTDGIKEMICLSRYVGEAAKNSAMILHAPHGLDPSSWQYKLFRKIGFKLNEDGELILNAERKDKDVLRRQ